MKRIILLLVLFAATGLNAQMVKFEGFVKDTLGIPLETANVLAINSNNNETEAYSITNEDGKFSLGLRKNTTYKIQASFIGFEPQEFELTTTDKNVLREINLKEGVLLEGVEIVHEIPVRVSGDTIVYNSDSFTNGTERKLGDILKKLPGVEVTPEGEVFAEGKQVTKLMVEGTDFFDGDTKLGTKNIPADAVDKIEVLKNYNEISQLKYVEDNKDNVAMNIKLKEGKKNFWFGDIEGGAGPDERYLLNPNLFYYSPKYSLNYIGNINNTGEMPFTFGDYFKFSGGLRDVMKKGGSNFFVIPPEIENLFMQNNKAKEIISRFSAANFNFNPNKAWSFSGFGIVSSNTIATQNNSINSLLNNQTGEVNTVQNTSSIGNSTNTLGLFKMETNFKPHDRFEANYNLFLKSSKLNNGSYSNTTVSPNIEQGQEVSENTDKNPFSVNQALDIYHTLENKKDVFTLNIQHLYQDEDPFYNAIQTQTPFIFPEYIDGQDKNNLNQEKFVKTNKFDAKLDYYHLINDRNQLNFTVANKYAYQNFNSHIFQLLDNGNRNDFNDPSVNNNADYTFNDFFAGVNYKFILDKFTFNPGISFHNYHTKSNQSGSLYENNFTRWLPNLKVDYQMGKNESIQYDFSFANNFTDINQLAEGSVIGSYNSLFNGNRTLDNSITQSHMLYYQNFNSFYMSSVSSSLRYNKTTESINNKADFNGVNSVQSPFNSDFANESLDADFRYSRSVFRNYKIGLGGSLGWSKNYNIQKNNETGDWTEAPQESYRQNYNASITTTFDKLPSLTLGYSLLVNNYPNDTYITHRPNARLEYYFLNGFSLTSNYQFYNYSNHSETVKNKYDFLDLGLSYQKPDSALEYRINATNLLNTKTINSDSFSSFSSNTSLYTVQPRYLLFSLTYKL
ncbi:outer membrane beta-barrel protein [Flavobacterium alkalisoli]|uniref:Outer membrane beta-barrel protein n=1 Tax=Flavobacterium alkalisoli TaxID=2602769 RepID=A0A5B9FU23_9FLAO|nr:TonB-dependent receptor [Flavobacterium alkalisoli]QEE50813.1 outer membrane beta-barrel protein [Flavobacterium alkalisoli]